MKLIASGVTFSAAIVRSPSFSRSSSSTTTTMRPARMSSIASGTVLNGVLDMGVTLPAGFAEEPLHVLRDHVDLEVDRPARAGLTQAGVLKCIRDQRHPEKPGGQAGDRQRHAVHRDRALLHDVAR